MNKEQKERRKVREKREANWSTAEKEYLRECIHLHLEIVILKKRNSWKAIQSAMASAGFDHDIPKLKSQWVRMKVSARKASAIMKPASVATGNCVIIPQITSEDNLVQSMIANEFVEDEILIDSNCVDEYNLVESSIAAEYLDCDIQSDENNNEKESLLNITTSPKSLQPYSDNPNKKVPIEDSPYITPLKNLDDIKKPQKYSTSKLQRLRNLPKTPSKNNIILERQNQIAKESLCYEEVSNLQKEKLRAEIDHLKLEKELDFLKQKRIRIQMEHDEELHAFKMEMLRKNNIRNHDLFDF